jgi:hypothetical protein
MFLSLIILNVPLTVELSQVFLLKTKVFENLLFFSQYVVQCDQEGLKKCQGASEYRIHIFLHLLKLHPEDDDILQNHLFVKKFCVSSNVLGFDVSFKSKTVRAIAKPPLLFHLVEPN